MTCSFLKPHMHITANPGLHCHPRTIHDKPDWVGQATPPLASFRLLILMWCQITIHQRELKTSAAHTSSGGRRRWGGLWVIRVGLKTETEDERERNARGRDERAEKEGERAVRNDGAAAFISLWICMWEGGTQRERGKEGRDGFRESGRALQDGWVNRRAQRSGFTAEHVSFHVLVVEEAD